MACGCESTSTAFAPGAVTIGGSIPEGQPVRLTYYLGSGGITAGAEVPVYRSEDGSTVALAIGSTNRLWLYMLQVSVSVQNEIHVYHGTVVGADSSNNTTVLRGNLPIDGNLVATLPIVELGAGSKLWVKSTVASGAVHVVGYGILVT